MTKTFSTFFALLLIAATFSTAAAQQSDYDIQQEFRSDYEEISNMIDNATTSSDLQQVSDRVEEFISEYSEHTQIINAALYPETASALVEGLRTRFDASRQRIDTIEELNERVDELNSELEGFRDQLTDMDQRTEQLQQELQESQATEQQVSALAQQYRENIQERDRFVTSFMTDLLQRYETVDASTAGELDDAAEQLEDNPVDLLRTILGEYVNYANQATGLSAPDYLSMKAQHTYFSNWWDGIGERMTQVFDADEPVQSHQEVVDLLANWNSAIDNRLWGTLNDDFSENGIDLANFSSPESFYNALQDYVSSATQVSQEQNREEDVERFRNFSDYWNETVKAQWGDYLVTSNVLNNQQISSIDQQLDDWNVASVPTSNLMLILFLVSIAVIIGLVVALVRKKD